MAKKASGKHYTSKGVVGVNKKTSNYIRNNRSEAEILLAKKAAWLKGKKVMLTIQNPNPNETRARFIRVNAREVWGDPKAKKAFEIR